MYLVLFENSPFLTALELASFTVLPSMDGVSHGRHFVQSNHLVNKEKGEGGVAVK